MGFEARRVARGKLRFRTSALALLFVWTAGPALAQGEDLQSPAPEQASAQRLEAASQKGPKDPFGRGVPRGSTLGYLQACRDGDYAKAAKYLDLRRIPREEWETRGPELARKLKFVLDQKLWVDVEAISDEPEGDPTDVRESYWDRVGSFETEDGTVEILLQRVPREDDRVRIWKVAAVTVEQIPALYRKLGPGPLADYLPSFFFQSRIMEVELWQWIGLMLVAVSAYLLSWAIVWLLVQVARPLVRRSRSDFDDRLLDLIIGPSRLAAFVGTFLVGTRPLSLSVPAQQVMDNLCKAIGIVAFTWMLLRFIDVLAEVVSNRFVRSGRYAATSVVPLGRKTIKVFVAALAILAALDSFGVDVTAVIAGLGVGGLAVALAAQKTIENLFGGATLLADQPVRVGDFCRFGDKVGTVEEVGLRSTRVRTLDRTVVTIPNAEFSSLQLENFAKRDRIWFHPRLGLRYETTPDQLRYVLVEIRRMLYAHPKIDPDGPRIRFVGFGAFSLDLDIFCYARVTDYGEFLEVAEDLNLRIMDIVEASGSGFAFPSQTMYLGKDEGLDADRARAAEEQVEAWKRNRELFLPRFPGEAIRDLRGTLEFPPAGSPEGSVYPRGSTAEGETE